MPQSPGAIRASVLVSLAALGTLSVGILILVGGHVRFSGAGFLTARQVAPWYVWGAAMVVSGTLALLGAVGHWMWLARIGHALSSVIYLFLVTTFVSSAFQSATTALTGIGVYTAFALMHAFAAASADLEKQTHDANVATKAAEKNWKEAGQQPHIVLPGEMTRLDEPWQPPRPDPSPSRPDPLAEAPWRQPRGNGAADDERKEP